MGMEEEEKEFCFACFKALSIGFKFLKMSVRLQALMLMQARNRDLRATCA